MGSEFAVPEATIASIQAAYRARELSVVELVRAYLGRIEAYDGDGPALNAVVVSSEQALARAEQLDREEPAGALHGIPVVLKDNINTSDLPTAYGSVAMRGYRPPEDATVARCGCHRAGQDDAAGLGNILVFVLVADHRHAQPVRPEPRSRRLELGDRSRGGGEPRDGGARHRLRGVHPRSGIVLQPGRGPQYARRRAAHRDPRTSSSRRTRSVRWRAPWRMPGRCST